MPLVLSDKPRDYPWPVSVPVPVDGDFDSLNFKARFRDLTQDRIEELTMAAVRRVKSLQAGEEPEDGSSDRAIAKEVMVGWEQVWDDDGKDVEYSEAALDQLLNLRGAATAIVLAWYDSINGKKAKN